MSTSSSTSTVTEPSNGTATDLAGTAQHGVQAAREHTGAAVGAAKEEIVSVVGSAADHARSFLGTAGEELQEQGRGQTQRLSGALKEVADELGRMAEQSDQSTPVVRTVRTLSEAADQFACRLDDGGPEGLMSDVSRFARRRPGTFLAVSVVAGFAAGRLVRSVDNDAVQQAVRSGPDTEQLGAGTPRPASMPDDGAEASPSAPGTAPTLGGAR
jgi:hypothetical protein